MSTGHGHVPYTYYSCPCVNTSVPLPPLRRKHTREQSLDKNQIDRVKEREKDKEDEQQQQQQQQEEEGKDKDKEKEKKKKKEKIEDEEKEGPSFDPRSPRANLSLFPLEYLLWCPDCQEIRCARCTVEEVVCWYCPTCLFEVTSSTVRSEGNRCTRNCYNCPICTCPLTVNSMENPTGGVLPDTPAGPYILMCNWCNWSSLDIKLQFEKPNNITAQINKFRGSRRSRASITDELSGNLTPSVGREGQDLSNPAKEDPLHQEGSDAPIDEEEMFLRLNKFYRQQINDSSETPQFSSFGNLSNLGNFGTETSSLSSPSTISRLINIYSGKTSRRKKPTAMREAITPEEGLHIVSEAEELLLLSRVKDASWSETTSTAQRNLQAGPGPRFVSDLWPVACLLRTKRSKRCRICRNLLAKPESKSTTSSRWKIRVLALNHIPKLTLRPLISSANSGSNLTVPKFPSTGGTNELLVPGKSYQFLLTVANPLFDPISVTLASSATTPGRVQSRIIILCPQFNVGANSDVWDEALNGPNKRSSTMPASLGTFTVPEGEGQKQAEAGKVWSSDRNWTSVIVEIQPGQLPRDDEATQDEDMIEIAMFVRIEYETDAGGEEKQTASTGGLQKEKRDEAFWCVLGAGKIKPTSI